MLDGGSGILSGCKLHSHCLLLNSPSADGGWFESLEWMSLLVTGISFQDRPLACLLISKIRPGGPGCEKILGIPNSFGSLFIEGPSICGAPNPGSGCHGWSCRKAMPCGVPFNSCAVYTVGINTSWWVRQFDQNGAFFHPIYPEARVWPTVDDLHYIHFKRCKLGARCLVYHSIFTVCFARKNLYMIYIYIHMIHNYIYMYIYILYLYVAWGWPKPIVLGDEHPFTSYFGIPQAV